VIASIVNSHILRTYLAASFLLYLWHPHFFEKIFFINEQISLFGMICFVDKLRNNWGEVDRVVFYFILLVFLGLVVSAFFSDNFYIFARNSSLLYSVFSFYAAERLFNYIVQSKIRYLLLVPVQKVNLIAGFAIFLCSPFFKNYSVSRLFYMYVASMVLYSVVFGGATAILASVFICIYAYAGLRALTVSFLIMYALLGVGIVATYLNFSSGYYGDIYDVMESSVFLGLDGNTTVRFLMWAKIMFEIFPENLLGVGFGTQMFDLEFIRFLNLVSAINSDNLIEYTLSPHNSFMYLVLRLGVVGLGLVILLHYLLYKLLSDQNDGVLLLKCAFLGVFVASFLNVVIESPIHAAMFWLLMGAAFFVKNGREGSNTEEFKSAYNR